MIALMVAAALAAEAPVTITGRAIPDTTSIGSSVRYEVEVRAPENVEVLFAQPTERIGPFEIVDFGEAPSRVDDGAVVTTRWFRLVGFEVGHHLIESPQVVYRVPGEALAAAQPVETRISIDSLVDADEGGTGDVHDIAAPELIPIDWRRPAVLAGAVLAVGALGFALWRWSRRAEYVVKVPAPPPHDTARRALRALEARDLVRGGRLKEYYAELSDIVRHYLEARFGVRAPEMTTEEFLLETARSGALSAPHRALLTDFLRDSDLVKFARHWPSSEDVSRALVAARRVIDETAVAEPEAA